MAERTIPERRPSYPCGATIPLAVARWIHTHAIVSVEPTAPDARAKGYILRLVADDAAIHVHATWGIELCSALTIDGDETIVRLQHNVAAYVDDIVRYERAHPDEPLIGTSRKAA